MVARVQPLYLSQGSPAYFSTAWLGLLSLCHALYKPPITSQTRNRPHGEPALPLRLWQVLGPAFPCQGWAGDLARGVFPAMLVLAGGHVSGGGGWEGSPGVC